MNEENRTLGELLSEPLIRPAAVNAIRGWDLSKEPVWDKTPAQIRDEHIFAGDISGGIRRLYQAAETGEWYYPLYTAQECAENPAREGTNLLWFPSDDPKADGRPYLFLVPGGGFVNVWNLTEGWPVAEQFNRLGYHVFILTYQVEGKEKLLSENMRDFARAFQIIHDRSGLFHVNADQYITCGFSAGGYLICLWNTAMGYPAFGLPRPRASFPVYPVTTLKKDVRYGSPDPDGAVRLYGCPVEEAEKTDYEIPDHTEGFPPCAIFVAGDDGLVNPENSRMLAGSLEARGIPCRLETGPQGGHGFADGSGMCMAGWTERAVRWYEALTE